MKVLIAVDMQNDFIDGALGTKEAIAIVDNVRAKIDRYLENGDVVIYTRDTHTEDYLQSQEGRNLPVVHCVKGTPGWEISEKVYVDGCTVVDKPSFGSLTLPETLQDSVKKPERMSDSVGHSEVTRESVRHDVEMNQNEKSGHGEAIDEENIESIELIGLCTDICVISNAMILKAAYPEVPITVDASCCAGVTPESHENALNAMRMCQIQVK
ncbi:MAG: cysteine hydrolase [Clostridiales bacterium]|nr:cysteine hydrolase [Clostridiales bacterium]